MKPVGKSIQELALDHQKYRRSCLNLIPSENLLSRAVLSTLANDLAGRYASRPIFYGGTRYAEKIWEQAEILAKEVFGTEHASVAPLSGHLSCMITLSSLSSRGNTVAALAPDSGGYPGFARGMICDALALEIDYLPYDRERRNIDSGKAIEFVRRLKPRVVVLGASLFLFPHPVKEISDEVHSYNGYVVYDGSHVLGLIAGGEFQKPLDVGVDVLFGSTHKTFPGPQGGVILCNDKTTFSKIENSIYHRFVDNIHLNRVAALGVALEEMRRYGQDYAKQIIENARQLARSLSERGFPIVHTPGGHTSSHQVFMEFRPRESYSSLSPDLGETPAVRVREKLEEAFIVVDSGVRLGTAEVTRRGMKNKEMQVIANLIHRVISEGRTEGIRKRVKTLLARHKKVKFSLDQA